MSVGFPSAGGGAAPPPAAPAAAAPAPTPAAPTPTPKPPEALTQEQKDEAKKKADEEAKKKAAEDEAKKKDSEQQIDYTKIPAEMDARVEQLDSDAALRPTIIDVGKEWRRETRTKKKKEKCVAVRSYFFFSLTRYASH